MRTQQLKKKIDKDIKEGKEDIIFWMKMLIYEIRLFREQMELQGLKGVA